MNRKAPAEEEKLEQLEQLKKELQNLKEKQKEIQEKINKIEKEKKAEKFWEYISKTVDDIILLTEKLKNYTERKKRSPNIENICWEIECKVDKITDTYWRI